MQGGLQGTICETLGYVQLTAGDGTSKGDGAVGRHQMSCPFIFIYSHPHSVVAQGVHARASEVQLSMHILYPPH